MKEDIIVVCFDPSQDWMNRSSIPKVTQPNMYDYTWIGIWKMNSIIFDVSQLTIIEQDGFVEEFCKRLMIKQAETPEAFRKRIFLVFEEAHTYFPEGCMRAKIHRNAVRMMTQGRNFNVRFACITQFASLIDKNAMRYMRQRYFGSTDEPNDVEYIKRFFPKKNWEDLLVTLGNLQAGQFIYKNGDKTELVQIQSFKSETTPKLIATSTSQASPSIINEPHSKGGGTTKAWATVITAFLWFMAMLYAINHR
jgi:hypothetical protein